MTPVALAAPPAAAPARHDDLTTALESFPALAASRDRLVHALSQERVSAGEIVAAVESDVALVIAVLRLANQAAGPSPGAVESVVEAVDVVPPAALHSLAKRARTFDFLDVTATWDAALEQFRLHAVATQRAADRLATESGYAHRDRLQITALLHDIGKVALMQSHPGYAEHVHGPAGSPRDRIDWERRELGLDHATVGAQLARTWGLPDTVASAIERHHDAGTADDDAAHIQLADLLVHYTQGAAVSRDDLLDRARAVGLGPAELRAVIHDLSTPQNGRPRAIEPCPLSTRELEILKGLAKGNVSKQIALDLYLSVSTVRSHLHNIYSKLGAVDRAQAVLIATARGWL